MMKKKVLITGGTGLVGSRLTHLLTSEGMEVHILSRSKKASTTDGIRFWQWSVEEGFIEDGALDVDHIIHLAGAGVADKRWTESRKKEIEESRTASTALLQKELMKHPGRVRSIACASAVGYYGDRGSEWLEETAAPGEGFLPEVCIKWEEATTALGKAAGVPLAQLRIGIVLSTKGGALPQLSAPIRFGLGAYLGNGKQYYPWIHIDDICRMFRYAIEHSLTGVYNASAPEPETNLNLAKKIAYVQKKWFLPVSAPAFAVKLGMGQMAEMVLGSQRTSSEKIEAAGFAFEYEELEAALRDVFRRKV